MVLKTISLGSGVQASLMLFWDTYLSMTVNGGYCLESNGFPFFHKFIGCGNLGWLHTDVILTFF